MGESVEPKVGIACDEGETKAPKAGDDGPSNSRLAHADLVRDEARNKACEDDADAIGDELVASREGVVAARALEEEDEAVGDVAAREAGGRGGDDGNVVLDVEEDAGVHERVLGQVFLVEEEEDDADEAEDGQEGDAQRCVERGRRDRGLRQCHHELQILFHWREPISISIPRRQSQRRKRHR